MRIAQLVAVACAIVATADTTASPGPLDRTDASVGEAIYLRGELPSGESLEAAQTRMDVQLRGADAACVNCHRRSGLGAHEGPSPIPPITAEYLFNPRLPGEHDVTMPSLTSPHGGRSAYTEATLAKAIRSGVDPDGRTLSDLMPRFQLDDASIAGLSAYLRTLTPRHLPGVVAGELHIATVITPDADPTVSQGVIEVLDRYVAQQNSSRTIQTPGKSQHGPGLANLRWHLHVWTLTGSPESWPGQLEKQFATQPVFALLSGVGHTRWQPVHDFCEGRGLPCLFPNVDAPFASERDFYSVYFSRGVLLEAGLMARAIAEGDPHAATVHQIFRRDDSGAEAAALLATQLRSRQWTVTEDALPASTTPRAVAAAVSRTAATSILVLWLRPQDIKALDPSGPPASRVYLSGLMGGLESVALPANWRAHAAISYPFELPQRRGVQLDYPIGWLKFRHIPIVDQRVQADTFLACSLLTDTLNLMSEQTSPAYLMEQLQRLLEHRTTTGYYPRLTLGTGQHFASRGGYIVHFSGPAGAALVPDTPWTIP